jgi:hypothetical protein
LQQRVVEFVLGYVYALSTCGTYDNEQHRPEEDATVTATHEIGLLRMLTQGTPCNEVLTFVYSLAAHAVNVEKTTMAYNRKIDKAGLMHAVGVWATRVSVRSLHTQLLLRKKQGGVRISYDDKKLHVTSDDVLLEAVTLKCEPKLIEHILTYSDGTYEKVSHALQLHGVTPSMDTVYRYCSLAAKTCFYASRGAFKQPRVATTTATMTAAAARARQAVWDIIKGSFIFNARTCVESTFISFRDDPGSGVDADEHRAAVL